MLHQNSAMLIRSVSAPSRVTSSPTSARTIPIAPVEAIQRAWRLYKHPFKEQRHARRARKRRAKRSLKRRTCDMLQRTIIIGRDEVDKIKKTCKRSNVKGKQGTWQNNDGDHRHARETTYMARCAELAVSIFLRNSGYQCSEPDFDFRAGRDWGDLTLGEDIVEVKSAINYGKLTLSDVKHAARTKGYVFQRLSWGKLTPTFYTDNMCRQHWAWSKREASLNKLLVGTVATNVPQGVAITISVSHFLKPVGTCTFVPLNNGNDRKRAVLDDAFI